MASLIELKDKNQQPCYPLTKAEAVYNNDGTPTIDKPLYTRTVTFDAATSATWRVVYVQITKTLPVGKYYLIKIDSPLDITASSRLYLSKNATINGSDISLPLVSLTKIPSDGCVPFAVTSRSASGSNAFNYVVFGQYTANGGSVTVSLYELDQIRYKLYETEKMVYRPIAYAARGNGTGQSLSWYTTWGSASVASGTYIIRVSGIPKTDAQTRISLMSAETMNASDTVKAVFDGTVSNGDVFYVNVSDEEASLIRYLMVAQYTSDMFYIQVDMFTPDQLYWKLESLKDSDGVPDYYKIDNYLDNKIALINNTATATNGVVFQFITDLHFLSNSCNSKYLLKEILDKTACSMVVCGGDMANMYGTESELRYCYDRTIEYAGYVGHDKWFGIVGNHDFYNVVSSSDSTRHSYTWGQTYNGLIRSSENCQISSYSGSGCYCVDNNVQKTRFIMLNTTEPPAPSSDTIMPGTARLTTEQLTWFVNAIKGVSGYNIIVFTHIASDPEMHDYVSVMDPIQGILEALANKTTYSGVVTANFTGTTNTLVCHISGHSHADNTHVSNGVLSISTTCDAHYQDDGWGAVVGTITEQAFDVYCIDYDARTINAIRIGRGENRSWTY